MQKDAIVSHKTILATMFTLVGCFGSHGSSDDAGIPDARTGTDSSLHDAGLIDAPGPDACDCFCGAVRYECDPGGGCTCPDECPLRRVARADLLCDFSHVTANVPTTISVALQGCYCDGFVECSASIAGDHVLALTTNDCTDPDVDCDGCNPFLEGTCDLPPLEEGLWRIDVNGLPSFELQVIPEDVLPERGSTCIRRGAEDESCGVGWPPGPLEPRLSCHPTHALPGRRVPITVSDPCGGCGTHAGPCKVDVFDDVIRVQPSTLYSLCDVDCPGVCVPRDDVCWTPRLEEGTWRVFIEGLDYESTIEVAPAPSTGEICGPIFPHG